MRSSSSKHFQGILGPPPSWRRRCMTQGGKLVTQAPYILHQGLTNSFYWQRNHRGKNWAERRGFSNACVSQRTRMCHLFLCTYQILHNTTFEKLRAKESTKGSQSSSDGPPGSLSGAASRAPVWRPSPGGAGPARQGPRASSRFQAGERRSAPPPIALSSFRTTYNDFPAGLIPGSHTALPAPLSCSAPVEPQPPTR